MVLIRMRMAVSRPTGVLGRSLGHADCNRLTAFAAVSLSSCSAVRWAASGSIACAIRSIGQSVSADVGAAQTSAAGEPAPAPTRGWGGLGRLPPGDGDPGWNIVGGGAPEAGGPKNVNKKALEGV